MKKVIILILSLFLLCACKQKEESISYDEYLNIKSQLELCDVFDRNIDFEVSLIVNPMNQEFRYDIIINNPSDSMYDITAVACAGEDDNAICPSIGLFDLSQYHLVPNYIDKENGFYKGINLSGIVKEVRSVKLYVSYYKDKEYKTKIEKYIEVFESETR